MDKLRVFKDDYYQKKFDKDGYVKLRLISKDVANKLLQLYEKYRETHETFEKAYHSTSDTSNPGLIKTIDREIREIVIPEVSHLFEDVEFFMGNFLVKETGPESEAPAHQDWTFVDEENYVSMNLWMALKDVDSRGGCLYFVPGSHKYLRTLRVSPSFPWAFENIRKSIPFFSKEELVKAGEGFVINHACIHGSKPNYSSDRRVACVLGAYSAGAELFHYYLDESDYFGNSIEKYVIDRKVFSELKKRQRPEQESFVEYVSFDFPQVEQGIFEKKAFSNYQGFDLIWRKFQYALNKRFKYDKF